MEDIKAKALNNIIEMLKKGVTHIELTNTCNGTTIYGKYKNKRVIGGFGDPDENEDLSQDEEIIRCLADMNVSPYLYDP